jgi:predicted RNase H-like HicB family nuclease
LQRIQVNLCKNGSAQATVLIVKPPKCVDDYIEAALKTARFEMIDNGSRVYAELPDFRGAWADGNTRGEATKSLREVLKGWIELQLERGYPLPEIKRGRSRQLSAA